MEVVHRLGFASEWSRGRKETHRRTPRAPAGPCRQRVVRRRLPRPRAYKTSGQLEAAGLGYCSSTPISPVHTRSILALWAVLGHGQCPGDSGRLPPRHPISLACSARCCPESLRWLLTCALPWVIGNADRGAHESPGGQRAMPVCGDMPCLDPWGPSLTFLVCV